MTIAVTEAMVNEVSRAFGVWNRARIKSTLERVFELAPDAGVLDVPVTARLHLQLDLEHLDRQVAEELARAEVRLSSSSKPTAVPALASVSELAERLGVARSTVAGWIKVAAENGMPAPLARLQGGPVYDLEAVVAWHALWKGAPAPEGA